MRPALPAAVMRLRSGVGVHVLRVLWVSVGILAGLAVFFAERTETQSTAEDVALAAGGTRLEVTDLVGRTPRSPYYGCQLNGRTPSECAVLLRRGEDTCVVSGTGTIDRVESVFVQVITDHVGDRRAIVTTPGPSTYWVNVYCLAGAP